MEKTQEEQREASVRTILAVSTLRRDNWKVFLRFALEVMTEEQLNIVTQKIGMWMHENPPKAKGS